MQMVEFVNIRLANGKTLFYELGETDYGSIDGIDISSTKIQITSTENGTKIIEIFLISNLASYSYPIGPISKEMKEEEQEVPIVQVKSILGR